MFIFFPLSHEKTTVKRIPVITLSLIAINVIVYIHTAMNAPERSEKLHNKTLILVNYYYDHPYLNMPAETKERLFSAHPELLDEITAMKPDLPPEYRIDMEQNMLDRAVSEYETAYSNDYYRTNGYIPARGGIKTLFYSMFLHGGFFHLFFNMIFLFLSGYILEDHWGRILYLVFYLSGGMVAALIHGAMFPESYTPLVGASGAVAALMGAFFIRFFKTRIYFFYFILIIIRFWYGRFLAPAYIMLPLWLLNQVYFALTDDGSGSGVAFWAHIGGFNFGCLFALAVKFLNVEDRVIAQAIDKKVTVYDIERDRDANGENAFEHREQARACLESGDRDKALFECKRALVLHLKNKENEEAVTYYLAMCPQLPGLTLKTDYQNRLVNLLITHGKIKEAALACKSLCEALQQNGDKQDMAAALARYAGILKDHLGRDDLSEKVLLKAKRLGHDVDTALRTPAAPVRKPAPVTAANPAVVDEAVAPRNLSRNKGILTLDDLSDLLPGVLPTVDPRIVTRTTRNHDGLILEGASQTPVPFKTLRFITAFQFDGDSRFYLDLFVTGEIRPYRISSNRVAYADFYDQPLINSLESFRQFIRHIKTLSPSLFTDTETHAFMDTAKIRVYAGYGKLIAYEKMVWSRLKDVPVAEFQPS